MRQRGEKADGFEISVSKTVAVPINELYIAWVDDAIRGEWLPEKGISITKATENKSVRVLWSDNVTRLSIDLYSKGEGKSQMVVQHLKIPDAEMAAAMKEFWASALNKLKAIFE